MVPAKTVSLPAVSVLVPSAALCTDVGEDQELVAMFYDARIPVSSSCISRQACLFLDVRSAVIVSSREFQHKSSSTVQFRS